MRTPVVGDWLEVKHKDAFGMLVGPIGGILVISDIFFDSDGDEAYHGQLWNSLEKKRDNPEKGFPFLECSLDHIKWSLEQGYLEYYSRRLKC
jgi:hypothetical protein